MFSGIGTVGLFLSLLVAFISVGLHAADTVPAEVQMPGTQPGEILSPLTPGEPVSSRLSLDPVKQCGWCHGGYNPTVEPLHNWQGSMMSHAARDPLFWGAADPVAGKLVYEDKCAACHGYSGEGVWDPAARKYIYPAVWGPFSFNDGAGMYRLRTAVGFIKGNMPYGWANPTDPSHMLSDAEAWDAMAYVISNERPKFAGAQQDWLHYRLTDCAPNWVLKVTQLDAGYEWYFPRIKPDGTLTGDVSYPPKYSAARHKYGPWKDMLAEMQRIQNAYLPQTPHPAFPDCRPFEYKEP